MRIVTAHEDVYPERFFWVGQARPDHCEEPLLDKLRLAASRAVTKSDPPPTQGLGEGQVHIFVQVDRGGHSSIREVLSDVAIYFLAVPLVVSQCFGDGVRLQMGVGPADSLPPYSRAASTMERTDIRVPRTVGSPPRPAGPGLHAWTWRSIAQQEPNCFLRFLQTASILP